MIKDTKTTLRNAITFLTDDYMINSDFREEWRNIKELETIADLSILYFIAEKEKQNK